jgi:hypothetical protein
MKKSKCCGEEVRIGKWTDSNKPELNIEKDFICLECMHKCDTIEEVQNEEKGEE